MVPSRRQFLSLCSIAGTGTLTGCLTNSKTEGTSTPTTTSENPATEPATDENQTPTETSEGWTRQAMFTADDVSHGDQFGYSIAVSNDGTTVIISNPRDGESNHSNSHTTKEPTTEDVSTAEDRMTHAGSAYIFKRTDGSWVRQTKLTADDRDKKDVFGRSVAISGDGSTVLIGADGDEYPNGDQAGSAYVFEATGDSWSQQAKLTADDGDSEDAFGWSVALSNDGTTALIGAFGDKGENGEEVGAAYVFDAGNSWTQQAKLIADDRNDNDNFGRSVAISNDGTTAVIGAGLDEEPNGDQAGSAYVFEASSDSWSQEAKLTADDGDSEDAFGWSVAVSGDGTTALIGATADEDPNGEEAGSAYIFTTTDGAWSQQTKLAPDALDNGDWFGRTVVLSDDGTTALVGAEKKMNLTGNTMGIGSAYLFNASEGSWSQKVAFPLGNEPSIGFGGSMALSSDGTSVLIGDRWHSDNKGQTGRVYVYTR